MQRIDMLEDEEVQAFIGEHKSPYNLLDIDNPITIGPLDLQDYFFEHKRQEADAMMKAPEVIKKVADEFGQKFGRKYGLVEEYRLDDAEYAIVVIGSTAGTAKDTVDMMRDKGHKVGLLRIRVFRPFPAEEIVKALKNVRVVGVMDRADGVNAYGGPVFMEVRAALYEEEKKPDVYSFVYGLGGRDVKPVDIERVFQMIMEADKGKRIDRLNYIGVRE